MKISTDSLASKCGIGITIAMAVFATGCNKISASRFGSEQPVNHLNSANGFAGPTPASFDKELRFVYDPTSQHFSLFTIQAGNIVAESPLYYEPISVTYAPNSKNVWSQTIKVTGPWQLNAPFLQRLKVPFSGGVYTTGKVVSYGYKLKFTYQSAYAGGGVCDIIYADYNDGNGGRSEYDCNVPVPNLPAPAAQVYATLFATLDGVIESITYSIPFLFTNYSVFLDPSGKILPPNTPPPPAPVMSLSVTPSKLHLGGGSSMLITLASDPTTTSATLGGMNLSSRVAQIAVRAPSPFPYTNGWPSQYEITATATNSSASATQTVFFSTDLAVSFGGQFPPMPTAPAANSNTLLVKQGLSGGQSIFSPDKTFRFTMQTDGNVVIYKETPSKEFVWYNTATPNPNVAAPMSLVLLPEGRLEAFDYEGNVLFETPLPTITPVGNPYFVVQNDGNGVIYDGASQVLWSTGTPDQGASAISNCGVLKNSQAISAISKTSNSILSCNENFELIAQIDGNVVLYSQSNGSAQKPVWATNSGSSLVPGYQLVLHEPTSVGAGVAEIIPASILRIGTPYRLSVANGAVTLVDTLNSPIWTTAVPSGLPADLRLDNDGSLYLIDGNGVKDVIYAP